MDIIQTHSDLKRVKVGWFLSHIYVDINENKVKDGKICLRALICQIVNDVMLILTIVGEVLLYLFCEQDQYLLYFTLAMCVLGLSSYDIFVRSKAKKQYKEFLQQTAEQNREKMRQAEAAKLAEKSAEQAAPEEAPTVPEGANTGNPDSCESPQNPEQP